MDQDLGMGPAPAVPPTGPTRRSRSTDKHGLTSSASVGAPAAPPSRTGSIDRKPAELEALNNKKKLLTLDITDMETSLNLSGQQQQQQPQGEEAAADEQVLAAISDTSLSSGRRVVRRGARDEREEDEIYATIEKPSRGKKKKDSSLDRKNRGGGSDDTGSLGKGGAGKFGTMDSGIVSDGTMDSGYGTAASRPNRRQKKRYSVGEEDDPHFLDRPPPPDDADYDEEYPADDDDDEYDDTLRRNKKVSFAEEDQKITLRPDPEVKTLPGTKLFCFAPSSTHEQPPEEQVQPILSRAAVSDGKGVSSTTTSPSSSTLNRPAASQASASSEAAAAKRQNAVGAAKLARKISDEPSSSFEREETLQQETASPYGQGVDPQAESLMRLAASLKEENNAALPVPGPQIQPAQDSNMNAGLAKSASQTGGVGGLFELIKPSANKEDGSSSGGLFGSLTRSASQTGAGGLFGGLRKDSKSGSATGLLGMASKLGRKLSVPKVITKKSDSPPPAHLDMYFPFSDDNNANDIFHDAEHKVESFYTPEEQHPSVLALASLAQSKPLTDSQDQQSQEQQPSGPMSVTSAFGQQSSATSSLLQTEQQPSISGFGLTSNNLNASQPGLLFGQSGLAAGGNNMNNTGPSSPTSLFDNADQKPSGMMTMGVGFGAASNAQQQQRQQQQQLQTAAGPSPQVPKRGMYGSQQLQQQQQPNSGETTPTFEQSYSSTTPRRSRGQHQQFSSGSSLRMGRQPRSGNNDQSQQPTVQFDLDQNELIVPPDLVKKEEVVIGPNGEAVSVSPKSFLKAMIKSPIKPRDNSRSRQGESADRGLFGSLLRKGRRTGSRTSSLDRSASDSSRYGLGSSMLGRAGSYDPAFGRDTSLDRTGSRNLDTTSSTGSMDLYRSAKSSIDPNYSDAESDPQKSLGLLSKKKKKPKIVDDTDFDELFARGHARSAQLMEQQTAATSSTGAEGLAAGGIQDPQVTRTDDKQPTPFEVFSRDEAFKKYQKESGIGYAEKVQFFLHDQSSYDSKQFGPQPERQGARTASAHTTDRVPRGGHTRQSKSSDPGPRAAPRRIKIRSRDSSIQSRQSGGSRPMSPVELLRRMEDLVKDAELEELAQPVWPAVVKSEDLPPLKKESAVSSPYQQQQLQQQKLQQQQQKQQQQNLPSQSSKSGLQSQAALSPYQDLIRPRSPYRHEDQEASMAMFEEQQMSTRERSPYRKTSASQRQQQQLPQPQKKSPRPDFAEQTYGQQAQPQKQQQMQQQQQLQQQQQMQQQQQIQQQQQQQQQLHIPSKMSALSTQILSEGYDVRSKSPYHATGRQEVVEEPFVMKSANMLYGQQQQQQQLQQQGNYSLLQPGQPSGPAASPRRGRSPTRSGQAPAGPMGQSQAGTGGLGIAGLLLGGNSPNRMGGASPNRIGASSPNKLGVGGTAEHQSPARSPVPEPANIPMNVPADQHMPVQLARDPLTSSELDYRGEDLDSNTLNSIQDTELYKRLQDGLLESESFRREVEQAGGIVQMGGTQKYSHNLGRAEFGTLKRRDGGRNSSRTSSAQASTVPSRDGSGERPSSRLLGSSAASTVSGATVAASMGRRPPNYSRQSSQDSRLSDGAYPDLEFHGQQTGPQPLYGGVQSSMMSMGNSRTGTMVMSQQQQQQLMTPSPQILEKKREVLESIASQKQAVKEAKGV